MKGKKRAIKWNKEVQIHNEDIVVMKLCQTTSKYENRWEPFGAI